MNDNIIIIFLFCFIFLISIIILTTYYKKEKFTQCQELEDAHINGLCKPFSGIPPAHAISPYYHLESSSYKHEPDESERIKKNKDAAREICNNTPGCGGISQAVKENGTNETYLCQNDWDGSQVINFDTYPMKTYKCKNQTFVNKGLTNNVLLSSNKNLEDFGKNFNQFIYNKHEGLKFPQQNLINIEGTNNPIKLTLKCQVDRREYYIETNLKKYIDFANTMKNCIGFHIKKTYDGYEVYFGTKIKNVELILDSDSNCITYSVKFIHYQNCTCQNNEWDVETHQNCSRDCSGTTGTEIETKCTTTSDRTCYTPFVPECGPCAPGLVLDTPCTDTSDRTCVTTPPPLREARGAVCSTNSDCSSNICKFWPGQYGRPDVRSCEGRDYGQPCTNARHHSKNGHKCEGNTCGPIKRNWRCGDGRGECESGTSCRYYSYEGHYTCQ